MCACVSNAHNNQTEWNIVNVYCCYIQSNFIKKLYVFAVEHKISLKMDMYILCTPLTGAQHTLQVVIDFSGFVKLITTISIMFNVSHQKKNCFVS